ncbi:hypothetical protein [Sulfolobus spindle-shaped virus]|nr:hypothetical protein [Sulfolobus spindle-shaped virus]QGA87274.1 hypothetical protein [Sulfolobus spindle-shaped virus]QGA87300.1 hypothetical protein [Sulfolobus spindle-shaped virus]
MYYQCIKCGQIFPKRKQIRTHLRTQHKVNEIVVAFFISAFPHFGSTEKEGWEYDL